MDCLFPGKTEEMGTLFVCVWKTVSGVRVFNFVCLHWFIDVV